MIIVVLRLLFLSEEGRKGKGWGKRKMGSCDFAGVPYRILCEGSDFIFEFAYYARNDKIR